MMILELPMTDRGGKWELRGEGRVQEGLDDHFNKKTQTTGSEGVMPAHPFPTCPCPLRRKQKEAQDLGLCSGLAGPRPPSRAGWDVLFGGPFLTQRRKLATTHWFQAVSEERSRVLRPSKAGAQAMESSEPRKLL